MTELLTGKEVATSITEGLVKRCADLKAKGKVPTLAIVRVGEDPADMAYERGAGNRAAKVGVEVLKLALPEDTDTEVLIKKIDKLNADDDVDGILVLRPLPSHIDDDAVRNAVAEKKDVDGIGDRAMAGVYSGKKIGYPPCTAEACMEILKYYGVELKGKRAVVIGRSLVIGRPVAMMLMAKHATITICHTRTEEMDKVAKGADVLIAAAGKAKAVTEDFVKDGQVIIDVGINVDEEGNMTGDVDFDEVSKKDVRITPVPGGVGAVTTSVLMKHVVDAAERKL